jgi:hypothetical protein
MSPSPGSNATKPWQSSRQVTSTGRMTQNLFIWISRILDIFNALAIYLQIGCGFRRAATDLA